MQSFNYNGESDLDLEYAIALGMSFLEGPGLLIPYDD